VAAEKVDTRDFDLIMPLGRGAFGKVFLVQKDDSYYALKVMKKRKYNGILNLVLTEKEVQRKIKHRFIVQLRYAF
jgi:serine/threonine protein kinase